MSSLDIRVVVIDGDSDGLARAAHGLAHAGVRVVLRRRPESALEFIGRVRPEVVLLGRAVWAKGWARRILAASPETVLFPSHPIPSLALRPERAAA
jgi:hypothetical protein